MAITSPAIRRAGTSPAIGQAGRRRWLILGTVALAQLMVVLHSNRVAVNDQGRPGPVGQYGYPPGLPFW